MTELLEKMNQFIRDEGKPCSVAKLGPVKDGTLYLTSRLLGKAVMLPEEDWPRHQERCLTPILNIRFDEVPVVPEALAGFAWATLYLDVEKLACGEKLSEGSWAFRTYKDLVGLVERECPEPSEKALSWTARDIDWEESVDVLDICCEVPDHLLFQPPWQNVRAEIPSYIFQWVPHGGGLRNHKMTKLGGFPSCKQWETGPSDPRNFVFQITYDREAGREPFDLCDCAISYIGLVDGEWVLETQTS